MKTVAALSLLSIMTVTASADFIMAIDSNADRVLLLDAFDGSVVNDNFIDVGAVALAAGVSSTPIEVLEVGNEFWVSDQVADRIWRFGHNGQFLGDIGSNGDLNNIRGMQLVGDTMYVSQGSASDNYSEGLMTIDINSLSVTGVLLDRDPGDVSYQDIIQVGNELYVTNSDTGNDGIERYSLDGQYLGNLVSSDGVTGLDFGQQMFVRGNGNILVGGFSGPSGVYEYASDGTFIGIAAGLDFGPRGAIDLGNGEILWGNGTWLRTDTDIIFEGGSFRYFTSTSVPSPSGLGLLALCGMCWSRRR